MLISAKTLPHEITTLSQKSIRTDRKMQATPTITGFPSEGGFCCNIYALLSLELNYEFSS